MSKLNVYWYEGIPVRYRKGTSDENVLKEVLLRKTYRKKYLNFDVEKGEHWLDLGANIGAFAVYCMARGATVECYEPEPVCFEILRMNARGMTCQQAAVSSSPDVKVNLWSSSLPGRHHRGTITGKGKLLPEPTLVTNVYAGKLTGYFTGVKMDIEGAEFGILDNRLLPRCEKLCLEYHSSRDKSSASLNERLEILKDIFSVVHYPKILAKIVASGRDDKPRCDCVIYCMGRKNKPAP